MSTLLNIHQISWEWPSRQLQKQRLKYFIKSLEDKEILQTLTPTSKLARKRGRPRFRLIDAIINDLEDMGNIIYKDQSLIYKSRAKNVMFICKLYEHQILEIINTKDNPG